MTKLGKDLIQAAKEVRYMIMTEDLKILKHRLQTLLRDNIVQVSFTKVDGKLREMKCTLQSHLIPQPEPEQFDKDNMVAKERKWKIFPENVLPVWDVEKSAWRSFRVDKVHDYITVKNEA